MALSALGLSLGLGIVDHLTGAEVSFSIFYVAPVALVAWYGTHQATALTCALTASAWLIADLTAGQMYSHPMIPAWNATVRLAFFLLIAQLLMSLKEGLGRERRLANSDALTGLANGRRFFELLDRELARSRRYDEHFTLAFIDADDFKIVNDRHGHAEGDRVLRKIAEALGTHVRETDVPARLGGDEFGILFPHCDEALAHQLLPRVRDELLAAMAAGKWPVGFSIGAVTVTPGVADPDSVLHTADELMYHVKATGKNAVRYGLFGPLDEAAMRAAASALRDRPVPPPRLKPVNGQADPKKRQRA
jgi:diguanylate cyclase (GGDEF)-like protein